jgi:hypothetical protein
VPTDLGDPSGEVSNRAHDFTVGRSQDACSLIGSVRIALRRPYTFVVLALTILIVGPLAAFRTPVDIFPDIRIPVIAMIWSYTGLPPDQMAGRVVTNPSAR